MVLKYRTTRPATDDNSVALFPYLRLGVVLSLKKRDAAALFLLSASCFEALADGASPTVLTVVVDTVLTVVVAPPSLSSLASSNWFCV